ncbi:MAG: hypothetical protein PF904_15445 [Kiritimatiellae bacterium]|jgi:hypothetical protein|nr:hypothetical protein [Kiritimatiellia bacterium]
MAKRYKGKVGIWEIWNEPDNKSKVTPEDYASFYIRTAEIIRSINPNATLYALALASTGKKGQQYADTFLRIFKEQEKLGLVNDITLHGYTFNPSKVYPGYVAFQRVVSKYSRSIQLRQGELGCPSEFQKIYALSKYEWTELSQAKWVMRKMMGDLGRDIPSSYFLLADIVYTHDHEKLMEKLRPIPTRKHP